MVASTSIWPNQAMSESLRADVRKALSFALPQDPQAKPVPTCIAEEDPSDHVVHPTGEMPFDALFEISSDIMGLVVLQCRRHAPGLMRPAWAAVDRQQIQLIIDQLCIARDRVFPADRKD